MQPGRLEGGGPHCLFYAFEGYCQPGFHRWEGMECARPGDCIGLLLDLDEGSMTTFKSSGSASG